jgi:hypothetical protein
MKFRTGNGASLTRNEYSYKFFIICVLEKSNSYLNKTQGYSCLLNAWFWCVVHFVTELSKTFLHILNN